MPTYQRAFHLKDLRQFPGWNEGKSQSKEADDSSGAADADGPAAEDLTDRSIVFVHEDLVVTKNCYNRNCVIFDDITTSWKAFCTNVLKFEIPDWEEESRQVCDSLAAMKSELVS